MQGRYFMFGLRLGRRCVGTIYFNIVAIQDYHYNSLYFSALGGMASRLQLDLFRRTDPGLKLSILLTITGRQLDSYL